MGVREYAAPEKFHKGLMPVYVLEVPHMIHKIFVLVHLEGLTLDPAALHLQQLH